MVFLLFIICVPIALYIFCVLLHALKLAFYKKNVTEKSGKVNTVRTMIILGSGQFLRQRITQQMTFAVCVYPVR